MPRDSFLSFRPLRAIRAPMNFQEWWLILLPAIFGFGWIAARVDMRHVVRQSRRLPRGYLRGLNHLLKDEEDKAIDAFLEVLDLEPEIIEVHFALGALFRRRGDIERAIRIHKTLSERDDLPRPTREEALFELARDYFKSGFWDRAEKLFEACRETRFAEQSLSHLFSICQREREWKRAIAIAEQMDEASEQVKRRDIAQLYCDWATHLPADADDSERKNLLARALKINPYCGRVGIIEGELAGAKGDWAGAVARLCEVEKRQPSCLFLAATSLAKAAENRGDKDSGAAILRGWLARHPSPRLFEKVFDEAQKALGIRAAAELADEFLPQFNDIAVPAKWAEARRNLSRAESADAESADFERLFSALSRLRARAEFLCRRCGFQSRDFQWQCPVCQHWETFLADDNSADVGGKKSS